jgi:hypothetical protein
MISRLAWILGGGPEQPSLCGYLVACTDARGRIVAGEDGGARTGPRSGRVVAETRLADCKEGGKVRGRSWRLATMSILVGAGLACYSLGAANGATPSGTGRSAMRATGDWGRELFPNL